MTEFQVYHPPIPDELYRERFGFPENIVRVTVGEGGEALLILGSDKTALIDCGMACFYKQLICNIHYVLRTRKTEDGRERTLDYIFCTHTHYDHIGALSAVKKEWPQSLTMGSEYAKHVFSRPGAIRTMQEMTNAASRNYIGSEDITIEPEYMQIDEAVHEGDCISLGKEQIRILETPGHTTCSLSYALEPQRILFLSESTGVLQPDGTVESEILKHFYEGYESLRKCRDYDADCLVLPHCGLIPKSFHAHYWELVLEDMEELVRFVADRKGRMTAEEMLEEHTKLKYQGIRVNEQPYEAFALNAKYKLLAAEEELERRSSSTTDVSEEAE